jgi:hypothetical protein
MISILIASAGRPEMLRSMLNSLSASTNWIRGDIELETVFVIDNDVESYNVAVDYPPYEGKVIDFSWKKRGALWAWNRALQLSSGEILVPCGDDQLFHGNWLDYALESHKEKLNGYGVVGMNDLAYNGNTQVATMWLFDRMWCKDNMGGVFAPPPYHYYSIDREWNEKAKMLGRFYWDERSVAEHLHSSHGKRPVDELDLEKMNAGWMEEDNKTFEERKAQGFPVTWESLI